MTRLQIASLHQEGHLQAEQTLEGAEALHAVVAGNRDD
jgi:hypothetical protein